jgi:Tol biopolymer transport system component
MGVYELGAPLGAGGMGQVYRARDTRLEREVALKLLPPDLADSASLARFEQEARHVAALNHPNIVAVFDVGSEGGVAYMVTELVDGSTLRGAQLPVRKVVEIGAYVADALAAAHAAGVTHRDIKPDNVMITREGRVKLLDFGVAKTGRLVAADAMTMMHTATHASVGTVGYMSPEQVRGGSVDHRADIFSTGALLYELLAGRPPFSGETAAEMMTATLRTDPPELPAVVPDAIQRIVRRCLEKNPEERFQSARDLAFALRQLTGSSSAAAPDAKRPGAVRWRLWIGAAAALALGAVAMGALVSRWSAARDADIDPIQLTRVTSDRREERAPAFSPDGRSIAFLRVGAGAMELIVQSLESLAPVILLRSPSAISAPVWSSDGNQVCYTGVERDLSCVGAAGGSPRRVLHDIAWPRAAPDGSAIYFIRVFEQQPWLVRWRSASNDVERVGDTPLPSDVSALSPVSPDGSSVIASARSRRLLVSLLDGARRDLSVETGINTQGIAWLPDSRHFVAAEEITTLIGSRLVIQDTRSAARRLVLHSADYIQGLDASPDGARVIYSGGPVERDLIEYSGDGKFVRTVAASSLLEGFPSWAPHGDGFVYGVGGPGQSDTLWYAVSDNRPATLVQRMTSNRRSQTPISPDGTRVAYTDPTGLYVVAVSGGRAVRALASTALDRGVCWSPDGEWIWYSEGPLRLARVPANGGEPVRVEAQPGVLLDCSGDGRWLVRRTQAGFVLTTADGKMDRQIASLTAYATRAGTTAQFGGQGKVVYLLGLDRRTIDVLDVDSGRKLRTIAFDIAAADQIEDFAFSPDGAHVLLTTGGDRNDLWMAEGFAQPATSWRRLFEHWESPPPHTALR